LIPRFNVKCQNSCLAGRQANNKINSKSKGQISEPSPLTFVILILLFICHLLFGFCHSAYALDKIIAVVNNEIITQKDLNDFLNFLRVQLRQEYKGEQLESKIQAAKIDLLNKLIEDRLILQEAKKLGVIVDENRIRAKIDEIKRSYGSDVDFQKSLTQQGLVQADLETKIREQFLMFNMIEYKIRSKIAVNPTEVTNFFQNNQSEFSQGETREFESISIDNATLAQEIYKKLESGKGFEETAKEYSLVIDKLTVSRNDQLKKEIENMVFKLKPAEISEPLKLNEVYYIFRLINILPPRAQNLTEVRDKIYTYLYNKKMEEGMDKWIRELKDHSYIKLIHD